MAEVAPSAGGGGGNRTFLLIIGGLAALLFIGLLALGAIFFLPGLLGGQKAALGPSPTPTRISIPPTPTRTPPATATLVVVNTGPLPTLAPGERRVQLRVDDDKNATLTTSEGGKLPIVQTGSWEYDSTSGELTLAFADINGKPFKDRIVVRLQEGAILAVTYNKALHGELGAISLIRDGQPTNFLAPSARTDGMAMPAAQATGTPIPVQGAYSGTLPGPADNARLTILVLDESGSAVLSTAESGKDSMLQLGTWAADGSQVTVNLTDRDGSEYLEKLVFELTNGALVGKEYNQELHGAGLELKRDPASAASTTAPAAGTYSQLVSLNAAATPIPITATPIAITATPAAGGESLPDTGLGEDMLMLLGGGMLLLGVIVVVRRMRTI